MDNDLKKLQLKGYESKKYTTKEYESKTNITIWETVLKEM